MFGLFQALADRIKALFVTNAALDFEADLATRDAERKADLLRKADRYEKDGKHEIASNLREQAGGMNFQQPLAVVIAPISHLQGDATALLPQPATAEPEPTNKRLPAPRRKNSRKRGS